MPIFSRRGDVIDLPELHRKGLVKFPEEKEDIDEIDFTLKKEEISENSNIEKTETSSVGDFLENFATIGVSNVSAENKVNEIKKELISDDLKWRIENTEYKIEQILERLLLLEKKIS